MYACPPSPQPFLFFLMLVQASGGSWPKVVASPLLLHSHHCQVLETSLQSYNHLQNRFLMLTRDRIVVQEPIKDIGSSSDTEDSCSVCWSVSADNFSEPVSLPPVSPVAPASPFPETSRELNIIQSGSIRLRSRSPTRYYKSHRDSYLCRWGALRHLPKPRFFPDFK